MAKQVFNYGDPIQGIRVFDRPTKRGEFVAEIHPAKVIGFSHPSLAERDWGWRGSVLVEFADGYKTWNGMPGNDIN